MLGVGVGEGDGGKGGRVDGVDGGSLYRLQVGMAALQALSILGVFPQPTIWKANGGKRTDVSLARGTGRVGNCAAGMARL